MVHTQHKLYKEPKSVFVRHRDLKCQKEDISCLGLIDGRNINALATRSFAGFIGIGKQQKLSFESNLKREFFNTAYINRSKSLVRRKSRNNSINGLEITIERINELLEDEEEDEYGEVIIPTEYAIQTAIELVSEAARLIPKRFFKAWVSTEDRGGVRLDWSKPELEKEVRLVIPATSNNKIYLYHETIHEYGVEYNVSAKTLSHWLSWSNF